MAIVGIADELPYIQGAKHSMTNSRNGWGSICPMRSPSGYGFAFLIRSRGFTPLTVSDGVFQILSENGQI